MRLSLIIAILTLFFATCKKDSPSPVPQETQPTAQTQTDNVDTLSVTESSDREEMATGQEEKTTEADEKAQQKEPVANTEVSSLEGLLLKNLDGTVDRIENHKNAKIILLDIWDTWCPPCRKEIPGFIELNKAYESKGLLIIGLALGQEGTPAVQSFINKYGINYPVYLPGNGDNFNKYFSNVQSIPTTLIVDSKSFKIIETMVGFHEKSSFEQIIKPYLD